MLSMEQIQSFYPEHLRPFKRNILREYIQYKILEASFATPEGPQLSFLGGTAIHIVHGNPRFSEDLDFDNRGLPMQAFGELASKAQKALSREGYNIEFTNTARGAFRANFRFIGLLQELEITGHKEEKLLIHFDAEPQNFKYHPDRIILNKFDVFCGINVVPTDILLAQKISCILERRRPMGRDFYDTVFLFGKTRPNAAYLSQKLGIENEAQLRAKLKARCKELNFAKLARDLEPFLIGRNDTQKVLMFPEFVASKKTLI